MTRCPDKFLTDRDRPARVRPVTATPPSGPLEETRRMTSTQQRLQLGTAPDSWGVWFAEDDHQVGWKQYLDEVAIAGYVWTELGPQGFLPQDAAPLRDELASRGLRVSGGTVFAGLHKGADALTEANAAFGQEARLLSEVGAKYLV